MTSIYSKAVALRRALERLAALRYGCAHRKTGFPITLGGEIGLAGQPGGQAETYVVCLECGRHLAYDWTTMRITSRRASANTTAPRCQ